MGEGWGGDGFRRGFFPSPQPSPPRERETWEGDMTFEIKQSIKEFYSKLNQLKEYL
jgi:hypothetical protein